MWYWRICSLISPRCIDAWSRSSHKSRLLTVPRLNQTPWFFNITRFWFYASPAWFLFFFVQGSSTGRNVARISLASFVQGCKKWLESNSVSHFRCLFNIVAMVITRMGKTAAHTKTRPMTKLNRHTLNYKTLMFTCDIFLLIFLSTEHISLY